MSDLKEVSIMFKDERIIKIKTRNFMKNENKFECFDEERKLYFVFNFNEIIYFTIEHLQENGNHIPRIN
ncbi:MAG: hypothetical protein SOY33_05525 [Candidatus Onthovivens sp.]|nr:hypothetical protein [Bacilli bacterium]